MLQEIVASIESHLDGVIQREGAFRLAVEEMPPARDLRGALAAPGLSVIAEIKRRSPSRGDIDPEIDPAERSAAYRRGGAAAISVLTEPDHFSGSPEDLRAARAAVDVPVLRKDFVIHPAQVWESRAMGADAILLIASILDDPRLAALLAACDWAGIDSLVEVHTEDEARRAVSAGARLIGVNNRDLATFRVDLATAERLRPVLGEAVIAVAESGVAAPADAARMAAAGYDAVLVGESAVRSGSPEEFVAALRGAG